MRIPAFPLGGAQNSQPDTITEPDIETSFKLLPPYNVILDNDDHHSMPFVVNVLRKVLGVTLEKAFQLMLTAHESGRAIVWSGAKEVAELKLEQITTFHEKTDAGKDLGPLGCSIEPAV